MCLEPQNAMGVSGNGIDLVLTVLRWVAGIDQQCEMRARFLSETTWNSGTTHGPRLKANGDLTQPSSGTDWRSWLTGMALTVLGQAAVTFLKPGTSAMELPV